MQTQGPTTLDEWSKERNLSFPSSSSSSSSSSCPVLIHIDRHHHFSSHLSSAAGKQAVHLHPISHALFRHLLHFLLPAQEDQGQVVLVGM
eukprot:684421-Hanusia_phi.AAC.4